MTDYVFTDPKKKGHIVKHSSRGNMIFYCGRKATTKEMACILKDIEHDRICISCTTMCNNAAICSGGEAEIKVGDIIRCPIEVSETGYLKIVGDQTSCNPNILQPGTSNWEYLVKEIDPENPRVRIGKSYFEATKEEILKWKDLYK